MGILQLVSLSDTFAETVIEKRYLRTPSNKNPSETSVMYYLRRSFFVFLLNDPDSAITKIIRGRQDQQILYRVTPFFKDKELLARGVEMEAYSVEDHGKSVCFHVFVYNQQPGITIDYQTGESHA